MLRKRNIDHELSDFPAKLRQVAGITCMVVLLAALFAFFGYNQFTSSGPFRREYEGRIVEKWLSPGESETGSSFSRVLLIEGRTGERFKVVVSESVYGQAQVGRWIKSSRDGVAVSPNDPEGGSNKALGER